MRTTLPTALVALVALAACSSSDDSSLFGNDGTDDSVTTVGATATSTTGGGETGEEDSGTTGRFDVHTGFFRDHGQHLFGLACRPLCVGVSSDFHKLRDRVAVLGNEGRRRGCDVKHQDAQLLLFRTGQQHVAVFLHAGQATAPTTSEVHSALAQSCRTFWWCHVNNLQAGEVHTEVVHLTQEAVVCRGAEWHSHFLARQFTG